MDGDWIPHAAVFARIGDALDITAVSRVRAGKRIPSNAKMAIIARAYDWPLGEQVQAALDGKYAVEFEKRIVAAESREGASVVGG